MTTKSEASFTTEIFVPMKAFLQISFSLLGSLLLTACGEDIDHEKIRNQGFVYCGQGHPNTFNPQQADSGITGNALSRQIFNTLLTLEPETHKPISSLATSWDVNEEGTQYTFKLRNDVKFQTTSWFTPHRVMNATDVKFSFDRILNSANPFHYNSHGRYPFFEAIDFQSLIKEIEVLDPYLIRFTLTRPDNSFLPNISTPYAVIHSAEYARQLQLIDDKQNLDNRPIGTGPFYLDEYQVGDLIRLRKHTEYWQGEPKMEQVVFDISTRGTGTLAKLLRNECDVLSSPVSSQLPIILETPELVLNAKPAMNVAFIALNTSHPALNDQRVRKALNLAINRQVILDSVYYGTGSIAYTLLPPTSWAYQKDSIQIRYDKNYALALLREAGLTDGLELSMWVPLEPQAYNPSPRKTAELIQSSFADIGVKLNLFTDDRFARSDLSTLGNVDMVLTGWNANTGDPDNFLRPLLSCSAERAGLNVSMWCNSDFDFLLDLSRETNQPRYRSNLYRQAQNLLNEEMPVIPLAHGVQYQANHKSLIGFNMNPFNTSSFHNVERVK
ncbi:antimicrobial peptide transporter subunit; periplasmic-binding component of ABC superfamily transporter [Vibrio tapetis subsp. tapetis]|uniref:Antimicrobial peptide transporter subunit periplasmic-binding component of ABC superfamily transporter n=2 Tax=Vibrio tapetis TaxID=52443 RepID=A0A2N8ZAD4_9VIBR|nr:antimicrobial peptide transporter subunit; periplasmic-binding component of ABC superfamily transporter [Vibrio tapetis subsp. tapetis]